jgi:hypothetical protein
MSSAVTAQSQAQSQRDERVGVQTNALSRKTIVALAQFPAVKSLLGGIEGLIHEVRRINLDSFLAAEYKAPVLDTLKRGWIRPPGGTLLNY